MFHSNIEIKEGAFFLSDAHYSESRPELLDFIKDIHSKKLQATQLIFFGDIFDTLFGGVTNTIEKNQEMITLLNDISKEIEFIYLEGNHDFNLKTIFPLAQIFTISQQPVLCTMNNKKVYLAHGDFNGAIGYKLYTGFIRNKVVLFFLNIINNIFGNFILNNLDNYLNKKDDCKEFSDFKDFISNRLESKYECEYFIEGHFHQNKSIELDNFRYINLGVFACNQRFFIVKFSKDKPLIQESIYSKEI